MFIQVVWKCLLQHEHIFQERRERALQCFSMLKEIYRCAWKRSLPFIWLQWEKILSARTSGKSITHDFNRVVIHDILIHSIWGVARWTCSRSIIHDLVLDCYYWTQWERKGRKIGPNVSSLMLPNGRSLRKIWKNTLQNNQPECSSFVNSLLL